MDLLNLKHWVQGLLSLQPCGSSWARASGEGNNFHTSPYTESTCFTLMQVVVLHACSKALPVTKQTLPDKHPWGWTFLACKASQKLDPCFDLEGLTQQGSLVGR